MLSYFSKVCEKPITYKEVHSIFNSHFENWKIKVKQWKIMYSNI